MAAFRNLGQAHAHQLVGGDAVQIFFVEEDGAGAGMQKPRNSIQNGGFTGTVGADEGDDLALVDLEGNALNSVDDAVIDMGSLTFSISLMGYASFLRPR